MHAFYGLLYGFDPLLKFRDIANVERRVYRVIERSVDTTEWRTMSVRGSALPTSTINEWCVAIRLQTMKNLAEYAPKDLPEPLVRRAEKDETLGQKEVREQQNKAERDGAWEDIIRRVIELLQPHELPLDLMDRAAEAVRSQANAVKEGSAQGLVVT